MIRYRNSPPAEVTWRVRPGSLERPDYRTCCHTVRDAVENAYQQHRDKDLGRFELFGYTTGVPTDAPDELVLSVVNDVLADPPVPSADSGHTQKFADVDFADHYDRVSAVYDELGTLDDGSMCIGNTDFLGWYQSRGTDDDEFDGRGRPWALGKEFAGMRADLDRVVCATISYAAKDWYIGARSSSCWRSWWSTRP